MKPTPEIQLAKPPRPTRGKCLSAWESGADTVIQRATARIQIKKILVPTDFSQASLGALRYAVDFAGQFDASLCLVHVVEPASFANDVGNVPLADSDREIANKLHHKLVMLARKEVGPLTPVNPLVCIGKPFHEITRVARTVDADLIVIATHGRSGLKRVFLGSTAERVVRHAPCPVLVVREKECGFARRDRPST
jgi:nucleotide-binding universal stress UspA family protein